MKKKLLAFVLALCIIVPYHSVLAGNPASGHTADTEQTIQDTIIFINPLYADTVTPEDLDRTVQEKAVQSDGEPVYHTSVAELGDQMREKLVSREKQITLYYEGSEYNQDVMTDIFHEAVRHTGVPDEGDYLRWQYAGWEGNMSGYVEGNTYFLTLSYTFTYYTTAQQEAEVDTAISEIRNQLELAGKDDYDKLQAIYGYICSHVTYDEEHADDADYKRKYTVHAAIFDHTAVCQGYALLVYRLALEEGIDCRFLAGMGNGVSHGWNIVKLGSYYYNVDATWDAGETRYQYFLRCDENFPEHYREADYSDETFRQTYPMDSMDYTERLHDHSHSYDRPVFIWSEDLTSCTAVWSCSMGDAKVRTDCTVSVQQTREPECVQEGELTHTAMAELDGTSYRDTRTTAVAPLGHVCGTPAFSWAKDLSACTAQAVCERCGETVETACEVSREEIPASCLETGSVTAEASVTLQGITYTDRQSAQLDATGHQYQEPVFQWEEDLSACTAVFTCRHGDDTRNISCTVTSMTTLPTCTEEGCMLYTAQAELNGIAYTDEKRFTVKALGHTYEEPAFQWSADYQSCTAMFPCSVCEETTPVACTVSSVSGGKKASCTLEDKTYTDFVSGSDIGVEHIFTDVPANAWYREYVQFVYDNGVMSGVSETEFAPKNPLTRAQMVQILYSYEKSPAVDGNMMFTDTQNQSWYYNAVLWAGQNQVVSGFPDNTFRPKNHITRQQLAVILYNYAGRPEVSGSLQTVFADSQQIGGWAADAVLWAYQNGIVSGIKTGNTLRFNPRGNATRAEAATMMKQFIQYLQ